jgi:hypothetical protein
LLFDGLLDGLPDGLFHGSVRVRARSTREPGAPGAAIGGPQIGDPGGRRHIAQDVRRRLARARRPPGRVVPQLPRLVLPEQRGKGGGDPLGERSSSLSRRPSTVAARCGVRSAADLMAVARTGLRLYGMADEAPRPAAGSAS